MIDLQSIERRFGDFSLSLSLKVHRGEYFVILGPSGSGKSLLLATIAGLFHPEKGKIYLSDRDATTLAPEKRSLGFVFQKISLFPHLSVEANLDFGLKSRGATKVERQKRVTEIVQTMKLARLLKRPVTSLSGGEAQLVAIGRALATRPSILLLDEPLSFVDHNTRIEMQEELKRIHKLTGVTVVHVTHNREEARAQGDRCAVMLGGKIIQSGEVDEVFTRPVCIFVSRFLGLTAFPPSMPENCKESCLANTGQCERLVSK